MRFLYAILVVSTIAVLGAALGIWRLVMRHTRSSGRKQN
jgi:multisubunit Na+/H+ antiporter MnhG subunit